ncbi:MAG: hypothetical protein A3F74_13075 [Betaproteobacteria bacterium RIFCSPLOWO2_12_FULL_62_58]|nr:MAG: hypothetical protein A3F74_13075 [Betaproteobacteria bacterium RIFCSPLOWO2_12_FULL_62_58]
MRKPQAQGFAYADALRWLRDHDFLDTGVLRCLPLDHAKFGEGSMFAPVFDAAKRALVSEPLLPRAGGGHAAAVRARLARTQELRELFDAKQLAVLFGGDGDLAWLSGDISQDRTPELRQYLMRELDIVEVTPEVILPKLDAAFLEAQSDEWVRRLYEFLSGQPALRPRAATLALIRLVDGKHVRTHANGQPQAFLPGAIETGFPTVRAAVCSTEAARVFLRALGLTEPDLVDDVVWNVLPKYRKEDVKIGDTTYEADIHRILAAFATDSKGQRERLLAALRETAFVMTVNAADGSKQVSKPSGLYLATERLKELFEGVAGVLLVDDAYPCLRGEDVRELLEACGMTRYLQPVAVGSAFTSEQLREMRTAAGCESKTSAEPIEDQTLHGLDSLLKLLPALDVDARAKKATLLSSCRHLD